MSPIGREELLSLLRGSDLLGRIPEHEIDALAGRVRRVQCARGKLIFMKRDEGTEVMFVAKGRVKIVSTSPTGTEVIHNIIEAGQVFGEMALLDGLPRSADAIAAVDSEIVELSRQDFLDVLRRNPETAIQMMAILCGRIRQSTSFVEDAVLLDSGTRLLHRLKTLKNQYGTENPDGSVRIDHKLSQQEIGESVGMTRVSVNRILSGWGADELIEHGRGYVIVHDLDRLEQAVTRART
ncbi:MAG: Crp/Fnr family transcriptional regulator [Myxococcota bacterium]